MSRQGFLPWMEIKVAFFCLFFKYGKSECSAFHFSVLGSKVTGSCTPYWSWLMIVSNADFVCTLFLLWRFSPQIAYLLVNGPDCPPSKLFKFQRAKQMINDKHVASEIGAKQPLGHLPKDTQDMVLSSSRKKWMVLMKLALWSAMSWVCILGLCQLALQGRSSITNMLLEWVLLLLACFGLVQSLSYWTRNLDFIGMHRVLEEHGTDLITSSEQH